jgi:hypothetical protein
MEERKMRALAGVIGTVCMVALWLLGLGIYVFTLYLAYLTSFVAILLTFIFPFLGQLYWIWALWSATGVFFNPLTIACLAWLGLASITLITMSLASK